MVPVICVALVAMVVAIYAPTLSHGFTNFDDQLFVTENPVAQNGITLEGLKYAATAVCDENWHPLTILAHMADCQLYGTWAGGHHLTCLLLHALGAVLLFLLLRMMTECLWKSALVTALWAVHPLRVESVAWIAELKDVLSGVFFFLTLIVYTDYTRRRTLPRYLLVMILFAFGLMSKPMLVTVPFVMLLLDYWPLGRWGTVLSSRLLLEKVPLLFLAVGDCLMTLRAQVNAMSPLDKVPVVTRIWNALLSYEAYLSKTLYPRELCVFYPLKVGEHQVPLLAVLGSFLLLLLLSAISFSKRRKRPYLLVGWLWYLGMLVPVIGIVQVGAQAYADRYTYLPLIGIFLAGTWLVADVCPAIAARWKRTTGLAVVLALLLAARHQVAYWRDNEILWRHVLACTPESPLPLNNLAEVLINEGRSDEAVPLVHRVVSFNPGDARGHNNLGNVLLKSGDAAGAEAEFREALRLNPKLTPVRQNLAKVLYAQGNRAEGIKEMREVLRLEPQIVPVANDLAWMLATAPEDSLRNGKEALRLARDASGAMGDRDPNLLDTLAAAYAEIGEYAKAAETARKGLHIVEMFGIQVQVKPGNRDLQENLRREMLLYEGGQPLREPR